MTPQSQSRSSRLLYATIVSTRFGGGSENPLRSALTRITGFYVGAVCGGYVMAKTLHNAQLPTGIPSSVLFAIVLSIGFILGGFAMLATGIFQQAGSRIVMQSMISLMPLRPRQRWFCTMLPIVVIWGILVVFGLSIVCTIAQKLGVSAVMLSLAWALGLLSGMVGLLARRPSSPFIKTVLFVGQVSVLLALFDHLLQSSGGQHFNQIIIVIYAIIALQCYGLIDSYFYHSVGTLHGSKPEHRQIIPKFLPLSAWFLVKLWRNNRTRTSFGIAMLLSLSTAISMLVRGTTFSDPYGMLILGAILAAMFACDIRGTMRRAIPPEAVLLGGPKSLVLSESLGVLFCGLIIGLPMYFALHGSAVSQVLFLMFYLSVQTFSSIVGLFAGTVFVPSAHDTGAQFFSAMTACSTVMLFPRAAQFSHVSVSMQIALWSEAAVTAWALIFVFEIIRRKQYGRT
ncbi:MAG: hypothetical protein NTX11_04650 [Candidatus Saccharibacteria bacterium]|nr:hypothetical protein [Candidatus Saccharibacteria bacterium]